MKKHEIWKNKGDVIVNRLKNGRFAGTIIFKSYNPEMYKKEYEELSKRRDFEEYIYFIGVDYDTPQNKPKHDFHTEFKVISNKPLTKSKIKQVIIDHKKDYRNVLSASDYEIKSDNESTPNKVLHRPSTLVEFTQKIRRK